MKNLVFLSDNDVGTVFQVQLFYVFKTLNAFKKKVIITLYLK